MAKKTPVDKLKAPFPYMGGKSKIAPKVWTLLGDPKYYMEPFSGSCAVLLGRPAPLDDYNRYEIINDSDHYIANFWRAVKAAPEEVIYHSDYPINETELHARHLWLVNEGKDIIKKCYNDPDFYDAKVAGWWVWGLSQWIGSGWCKPNGQVGKKLPEVFCEHGIQQYRRPSVGHEQGIHVTHKTPITRRNGGIHEHQNVSNQIPQLKEALGVHSKQPSHLIERLSQRLRNVKVLCGDWSRVCVNCIIKNYPTAIFLDPPYRDYANCYNQKVVNDEVEDFCKKWEDKPNVKIVLCGYEGEYNLPKWTQEKWKANVSWSGGKGGNNEKRSKETLWISPSCAKETPEMNDMFAEDNV